MEAGAWVFILELVLEFVGGREFLFVAGVNRKWRSDLKKTVPSCKTLILAAAPSPSRLEWGRACGMKWSFNHSLASARDGNALALQWASEKGLLFGASDALLLCEAAALGGKLNVLRWLYENGLGRRSRRVCWAAARSGRREITHFLAQEGWCACARWSSDE
ncbi:unnamed protein product [Phaeothamnion confervicola]